jgi:uncharacterized protein YegL
MEGVMKQDLTELLMILDMSGSMYSLRGDTIGGYNSLIEEQKKEPGEAKVTTVLFNNNYSIMHDRVDINDVKPMTDADYVPQGTTAMLDAVGKAITSVGQALAATPEEERPSKVMVTIITDGYENASVEYNWDIIKKMIKEQREKYNWIFTFIGADIDTMQVSSNLGIDSMLSKSYTKSAEGSGSVYAYVSKAMKRARASVDSVSMEELSADLDEIK